MWRFDQRAYSARSRAEYASASSRKGVNQPLHGDAFFSPLGQPEERVLRLFQHEHRLGIEAEIDAAQHRPAHAMAHHDGAGVVGDDVAERRLAAPAKLEVCLAAGRAEAVRV